MMASSSATRILEVRCSLNSAFDVSKRTSCHGQKNPEACAAARVALCDDPPLVFINDGVGDGQPQAEALGIFGEERIKDVVNVIGTDARAGV